MNKPNVIFVLLNKNSHDKGHVAAKLIREHRDISDEEIKTAIETQRPIYVVVLDGSANEKKLSELETVLFELEKARLSFDLLLSVAGGKAEAIGASQLHAIREHVTPNTAQKDE